MMSLLCLIFTEQSIIVIISLFIDIRWQHRAACYLCDILIWRQTCFTDASPFIWFNDGQRLHATYKNIAVKYQTSSSPADSLQCLCAW